MAENPYKAPKSFVRSIAEQDVQLRIKPRNPILAGLASLVFPGLGHMYVGRLGTGIVLLVLIQSIAFVSSVLGIVQSFEGAIAILVTGLLLQGLGVVHSVAVSRREKEFALTSYNRWFYYVVFVLIYGTVFSLASHATIGDVGDVVDMPFPGTKSYRIASVSMQPTLYKGERIIVDLLHYKKNDIERGDVVVFKLPDDPISHLVHRVIACAGDEVAIDNGVVRINNKALPEPYILPSNVQTNYSRSFSTIVIPDGHLFLMGDSRDKSRDSRFIGTIPEVNVLGKVLYIYWSNDGSRIGMAIE